MRLPRLSELPDQVSATEFWDLLGGSIEHERLEFKSRPGEGLYDVFAAMAMTDGGLVLLGVEDRTRAVVGCPLTQAVYDAVKRASHAVGVDVQIQEVRVDRVMVTAIAVPDVRERIVTTPNGRLLRRVGSENQPLVGDALGHFVSARLQRAADEQPLPMFDLKEVNLDLVNRALAGDARPRTNRQGILRALVDLGCAHPLGPAADPAVMAATAMLFAKNPERYVSGARVQLVRRVGVGPDPGATTDRVEVTGPIPVLVERMIAFVDKHTPATEVVSGRQRERVPAYPATVMREAVVNALAHRDYGLAGATVDVTVWDDRVEIKSPGGLPGHVTVDNIRDEHFSRNRIVMRVLKLLGLVEEYGEGVDRMFREMEERLLQPPSFAATPASVTVTLKSQSRLSVEDQVWLQLLGRPNLSTAERLALVEVRRQGVITRKRAAAFTARADGETLLRALVAKGLLRQVGQRGGSRYVLTPEVVIRAGSTGIEARARRRDALLDDMRRRGSLSVNEGAALLDGDVALARDLLREFVLAGLARAEGNTSARRYFPV